LRVKGKKQMQTLWQKHIPPKILKNNLNIVLIIAFICLISKNMMLEKGPLKS
jgi:hypothetical protein